MTKAKILVVEDEGITAEDIKDYLTSLGYEVLGISSTGEDALQKVKDLEPDLVLMDIMLAGVVDGTQAAEIIREQFDIPVVYLTAYSDPQTLERAKITDPYGYILKPFDQRDLQIGVEIALHKHGMLSQIRANQRWLSTTLASVEEALIAVDDSYRIITMNRAAEKLTGWKMDEARNRIFTQVYTTCHAITGEDLPTPIHMAFDSGDTVERNGEALLIARGGLIYPVDETASLIVDKIHGVQGAVLVFRDATHRLHTEESIKDELVPAILDSVSAFLVITDASGKIIRFNAKARDLTGLDEEEASEHFFWDFCADDEDKEFASSNFEGLNGVQKETHFDCNWKSKFDDSVCIRWRNSVIREGDEISYIICTGIDLDKKK